MPEREVLAYAAGLFEGEGTVGAYRGTFLTARGERRQRKTAQIQAQVKMTDREPLDAFCVATGLGRITGPYTDKNPRWKPVYSWQISGFEQVQALAAYLWPWLGPRRREQFRAALLGVRYPVQI